MNDISNESLVSDDTNASDSVIENRIHTAPCMKHAAQNISRKARDIPSEKIKLCNDCSQSMLSYIFLVQDFLDSLANEICSSSSSVKCLQCAREAVRENLISRDVPTDTKMVEKEMIVKTEAVQQDSLTDTKILTAQIQNSTELKDSKENDLKDSVSTQAENVKTKVRKTSRSKATREPRKYEKSTEEIYQAAAKKPHANEQNQKVDFLYNVTPVSSKKESERVSQTMAATERRSADESLDSSQQYIERRSVPQHMERDYVIVPESPLEVPVSQGAPLASDIPETPAHKPPSERAEYSPKSDQSSVTRPPLISTMVRQQPDFSTSTITSSKSSEDDRFSDSIPIVEPSASIPRENSEDDRYSDNISIAEPTTSMASEDLDGIISTLSNVEREVYDTARDRAGWEGLTESQERLGASATRVSSEAFVTSCRNNAEALGCLVVGTSLLLTRTSRTLCVLVSEGVSSTFRGALSSVFHTVQYVRSLDSLGTTKLALLEQPDLGVTFEKLHVWRLVQFRKCVYLNPDTLVIQNCDELFEHEELSAVPDIGWPDCFNSGVFVYEPSVNTFWQLLEFAEKQGSYDGGDQGLLNSFFGSWSQDISKKLSFIYNLMANVSYTYTPAFRQFGRDVKIVQFHGSFKPWHVKFFSETGQISPSSPVHPTYVQFVHIWLNIFRISVLRLMSEEIQSYARKENVICAVEILRFFPLPSESEVEFYLSPPSVRVRLAEKRLQKSDRLPLIEEAQRRKSAEFPCSVADDTTDLQEPKDEAQPQMAITEQEQPESAPTAGADDTVVVEGDASEEVPKKAETSVDEDVLPGSKMGDYQRMKAWEQGRMDYQGSDSSENIIKRLEFLMSRTK